MNTPNYRETEILAQAWRRASQVWIDNPLNGVPSITFVEQDVLSAEDTITKREAGSLPAVFDPPTVFQLRNPVTGEELGQTSTHQDLFVLLYSLYIDLAVKRDQAQGEGE